MPRVVDNNSKIVMYADDTSLVYSNKDIYALQNKINENLISLDSWLTANLLTLNVKKTCFIIITLRPVPEDLNIKLKSFSLNRKDNIKFLGVTVDSKLTFKNHINEICSKVSKTLGIMRKLNYLPSHVLLRIYFAMIFPYLIYCIEAWGSIKITNISPLFVKQKMAIKVITSNDIRTPSAPLFKDLSLLRLDQLYEFYSCIYFYKIFNMAEAPYIYDDIEQHQVDHGVSLRNRENYRKPRVNNIKYKQSFLYSGLNLWNELSSDIRNKPNLNSFRNTLNKHLKST